MRRVRAQAVQQERQVPSPRIPGVVRNGGVAPADGGPSGELAGTLPAVAPAERALAVIATLAVTSPASKTAGEAMLAQRFTPLFPIDLAEKDLDYVRLLGASIGTELPVVQRVAQVLATAQQHGLGAENLTALAKLYP